MTEKHNGAPERPLGKCVLAGLWAVSAIDFSRTLPHDSNNSNMLLVLQVLLVNTLRFKLY